MIFFIFHLSDRQQYTVIDRVNFALKKYNTWVPRWSILGPLFFAMYINDTYIMQSGKMMQGYSLTTQLYLCITQAWTLLLLITVIRLMNYTGGVLAISWR